MIQASFKVVKEHPRLDKLKYYTYFTGFKVSQLACWLKNLVIKPQVADKNILIVVGGGPAPGIPNAIRATAVTALRNGFRVYASRDGFKGIKNYQPDAANNDANVFELTYKKVWDLKHSKRNPLGTDRYNPAQSDEDLRAVAANLKDLRIAGVVAIGGDDTFTSARAIYEATGVPCFSLTKTIDDDLLPAEHIDHTFGVSSASTLASYLIENLRYDEAAMKRWHIVRIMGRSSGSLAAMSADKAGAHCLVIAEQYQNDPTVTLKKIVDDVRKFMDERIAAGYDGGVIVLSEGLEALLIKLAKKRGEEIASAEDEHGNPILDLGIHRMVIERLMTTTFSLETIRENAPEAVPLLDQLFDPADDLSQTFRFKPKVFETIQQKISNKGQQKWLLARFKSVAQKEYRGTRMQAIDLSYVLRTADPDREDIRITSREGRAAVRLLMRGEGGYIVSMKDGEILPVPYDAPGIFDESDKKGSQYGKAVKRYVDVNSRYFLDLLSRLAWNARNLA